MGRIAKQNQTIRALVLARQIKLMPLAITRTEAVAQFVVSKRDLAEALDSGLLGYSRGSASEVLPVWRLERLYPRRDR